MASARSAEPAACHITACAIVPAYPNELTPPTRAESVPTAEICTGSSSLTTLNTLATCELSNLNCALAVDRPPLRPTASLTNPVIPAAGSACPMLAFTPPKVRGSTKASPHDNSTAATSDPASIGSPSAVPVPCASLAVSSPAPTPASAHAAPSSACCACPIGAVRLALRPSCRTALPSTPKASTASPAPPSTSAPHASPRA
eukprot:801539-Prymnesium_polylepis.1